MRGVPAGAPFGPLLRQELGTSADYAADCSSDTGFMVRRRPIPQVAMRVPGSGVARSQASRYEPRTARQGLDDADEGIEAVYRKQCAPPVWAKPRLISRMSAIQPRPEMTCVRRLVPQRAREERLSPTALPFSRSLRDEE